MIDFILAIIFCVMLYRMAKERGVPTLPYVMNYLMGVILMGFVLALGFIYFYGMETMFTEKGQKIMLMTAPISISFEVFLFIWLRNRIRKVEMVEDEVEDEEDEHHSPDTDEKKDFSYFR